MKMRIFRRNDGREFVCSEDTIHVLSKRADMRLLEVEIDPVTRKRLNEVDLTQLGSATQDLTLREAIARKWPHVLPLLDRPDLVRVAMAGAAGGNDLPPVDAPRFDVAADSVASLPPLPLVGVEDVDATPPDVEPDEVPPAGPAVDAPVVPPDPIDTAVMLFEVQLREAPSRDAVAAAAAAEGITVSMASKSNMIKQAVDKYRAKISAKE
jgi:hypothetical protein